MIREGLAAFRGKSVLLLQGPMGPFFRRLASDLHRAGATVRKVNFNAGDCLFYPESTPDSVCIYRGTLEAWPEHLADLLVTWRIDVVLLFGDCRPIHQAARDVVLSLGLELGVFEEGYVRPDYVTLERFGVNGHSRLPRTPGQFRRLDRSPPDRALPVGNAYWHGVVWSTLYATATTLGASRFPHYRHHRPLDALEALRWLRSAWRKQCYRISERGMQAWLSGRGSGRFFLVPLQVHNDAQIHTHSRYESVPAFLESVMRSFAEHAPAGLHLVIKHHPLDRAYTDYTRDIDRLASSLGLSERVAYIHDQHMPTLLRHARGVVLINSTVGLQAIHHGCAVKVCGRAIFDIEGLTYQGELASFWRDAPQARPDMALFARFHEYLVATTQLNGNFYRRLPQSQLASGLRWSTEASDAPPVQAPAPCLDVPSKLSQTPV
jgi:capsular polysaccharide export protein